MNNDSKNQSENGQFLPSISASKKSQYLDESPILMDIKPK